MAGTGSLAARVRRLEAARGPGASPFRCLDTLESECRAGIDAGLLDGRDVPELLAALGRWEREGAWAG